MLTSKGAGGKLVSVDQLLDVLPQLRGNNTDTGWCYLTQAVAPSPLDSCGAVLFEVLRW